MQPLKLDAVEIEDELWSRYQRIVREDMIPYQWEVLNDRVPGAEPSHAIRNFRIAAGLEEGEFQGFFFQDTDLSKWLEAVSYSLQTNPDPELEAIADEAIGLMGKAQGPDGYLNSYFSTAGKGRRWTNLQECHELYTAGHLIEAAVAYKAATGKRRFLDIARRLADCIDAAFGPEPGKLKSYDGHQEIELALVKLYRSTGERRYLELAKFFIDQRGTEPYCFVEEWERRGKLSAWTKRESENPNESREYLQTHVPVRKMEKATGHAVRMVYMLSGMADLASEYDDEKLLAACRRLMDNIAGAQMYVTGGIGASHHGEAFTFDYDLPNDTMYAETCASCGLIFAAHRMLMMEADSRYADLIERALYNTVASAMSMDGKSFFYVNPLEVWPEASARDPGKKHVKPVRQKWFSCACCPPNLARLIASLGSYVYSLEGSTLFVNLYIGGKARFEIGGALIELAQTSEYPWKGDIDFRFNQEGKAHFALALRIPDWSGKASIKVNGTEIGLAGIMRKGYAVLEREWSADDRVSLSLDMEPRLLEACVYVHADAGKLAIQRGPLVYCIEEADNGKDLADIEIPIRQDLSAEIEKGPYGRMVALWGKGFRRPGQGEGLYRPVSGERREIKVKAIPYFAWGNRKPGEMLVWIRSTR